MRRSRLALQKIYSLVQKYFKENTLIRLRQRGRPRTYDDTWILTLWLYQTLWRASYREVLEIARQAGFPTPALSIYHYRVSQLPLKLFQYLVIQIGKDLARKNSRSWRFLLVDGSGFGFKEYYELSLRCGESLRKVRSQVRLVILVLVEEKGRGILMVVSVGRAYASESRLLLDTLEDKDCLVSLQVVGDGVLMIVLS